MNPFPHESADDAEPALAVPGPLRIQVAAVAAQQIALDEREIRLAAERTAFEHQQQHIAAHVEAKRRELLSLSEQAQAERALAQQERQAYEHQQCLARQRAEAEQSEAFEARERCLQDQEDELNQRILRFNTDEELARFNLREAWAKLRLAQLRWKRRRGLERAALRVRSEQVETAAVRIAEAHAQLEQDQRVWQSQRQALEVELEGVNARVQNQRRTLNEQEVRLRWLEREILRRQQQLAATSPEVAATAEIGLAAGDSVSERVASSSPAPVMAAPAVADAARVVDLDRLAEELADQRWQLVESWARLVTLHEQWHFERAQVAAELESFGQQLLDRDRLVQEREQAGAQTEAELRQRHEELIRAQQQLIAWGAQLRLEENAWAAEKSRLLSELETNDAAAEQRQAALIELGRRWAKRRKREADQLECQRIALGAFRKEITKMRMEAARCVAAADVEERILAELRNLDERYDALDRRAAEVAAAEAASMEKQTAWEQQQFETRDHYICLEHELRHAQTQRLTAEQQIAALRDEVERIARALLDQSDPPTLPFEQAA